MNHALKKFSILLSMSGLALFFLSNCAGKYSGKTITVAKTKGFQQHHGPFDENGNYIEAWADNPPRRIYVDPNEVKNGKTEQVAHAPVPKPDETSTPYQQPRYNPTAATNTTYKPKPKKSPPKKTAVKVTPKRKPSIVHTVKKGDTLYSLARKYRSSVKTIMSANNLKSSTIRIGQKLKIPRF